MERVTLTLSHLMPGRVVVSVDHLGVVGAMEPDGWRPYPEGLPGKWTPTPEQAAALRELLAVFPIREWQPVAA